MKKCWVLIAVGLFLSGCQQNVKSSGTAYEEIEVMARSERSVTIRFAEFGRARAESYAADFCAAEGRTASFDGFEKKFGMSDIGTWRCD